MKMSPSVRKVERIVVEECDVSILPMQSSCYFSKLPSFAHYRKEQK